MNVDKVVRFICQCILQSKPLCPELLHLTVFCYIFVPLCHFVPGIISSGNGLLEHISIFLVLLLQMCFLHKICNDKIIKYCVPQSTITHVIFVKTLVK